MKIPKIKFRYSSIYNDKFRQHFPGKKYPTEKQILKFKVVLEREWHKNEKKILTTLSKITGLAWKEKEILVYIVGSCIPFSDPLTIGSRIKPDYACDILTHELIHRIWFYGDIKNKTYPYFIKKYKGESHTTIIHIPVLAIHWKLFLDLFDEKRLARDREFFIKNPPYNRAYEIVAKEGYDKIVNKFKSLVK